MIHKLCFYIDLINYNLKFHFWMSQGKTRYQFEENDPLITRLADIFTVPPLEKFKHLPLCDLELLCVVLATNIFAEDWQQLLILGETDSEPCFFLLKNGSSREEIRLQMARHIAEKQVQYNFLWKPTWLSTHDNIIHDALSRWNSAKHRDIFFAECSRRGITPVNIPLTPEMFNF